MEFEKWLLEREDATTINKAREGASYLYDALYEYYKKLFVLYFPKPKEIEDHERKMRWRDGIPYEKKSITPSFQGAKLEIYSRQDNLKGEYKSKFKTIIIYDKEIGELSGKLESLHDYFEYHNRITTKSRWKAKKFKTEAKKVLNTIIIKLNEKREEITSTIFHELIHRLDDQRIGSAFDKVAQNNTENLDKKLRSHPRFKKVPEYMIPAVVQGTKEFNNIFNKLYANDPLETNAWFLTAAQKTLKNSFSSFDELLDNFKQSVMWDRLNEKNKRKMINRLYVLYSQKQT